MVLVQMSTPVNLVLCIESECLQVSGQIGKGQHRPKTGRFCENLTATSGLKHQTSNY